MTRFASSRFAVLCELWERDFFLVLSPSPVALFAIGVLYVISALITRGKLFNSDHLPHQKLIDKITPRDFLDAFRQTLVNIVTDNNN